MEGLQSKLAKFNGNIAMEVSKENGSAGKKNNPSLTRDWE
jgi:hypothetical protein